MSTRWRHPSLLVWGLEVGESCQAIGSRAFAVKKGRSRNFLVGYGGSQPLHKLGLAPLTQINSGFVEISGRQGYFRGLLSCSAGGYFDPKSAIFAKDFLGRGERDFFCAYLEEEHG
jgi:hypothetical protein